jgi:hypothetical protein
MTRDYQRAWRAAHPGYDAHRMARKRENLAAAGLCADDCGRDRSPGLMRCGECLATNRARVKASRARKRAVAV